jgi:hypothetical protein
MNWQAYCNTCNDDAHFLDMDSAADWANFHMEETGHTGLCLVTL